MHSITKYLNGHSDVIAGILVAKNQDLIDKLISNGVKLFVCSQATAARGIDEKSINIKIQRAFSGLSVLATYQLNGYILMPY